MSVQVSHCLARTMVDWSRDQSTFQLVVESLFRYFPPNVKLTPATYLKLF